MPAGRRDVQPRRLAIFAAAAILSAQNPADAASKAGDAEVVVRRVSGVLAGTTRTVNVGDDVFQNETIRTEPEGNARLILLDKTRVSIGSSASLTLDRFIYGPNGTARSAVLTASRGVLRWISGASPSRVYQIRTPHALLGVRGTAFDLLITSTETAVVLLEGSVNVCPRRRGGGTCESLDRPGAMAVASSGGVAGPSSPRVQGIDLASAYRELGGTFLSTVGTAGTVTQAITGLPGVGEARSLVGQSAVGSATGVAGGVVGGASGLPGITFGGASPVGGGAIGGSSGPIGGVVGGPSGGVGGVVGGAASGIGGTGLPAGIGLPRR